VGLTQECLAHDAKIDLTYLGGIERGRRNPSLMVMARIAMVLGVRPAALLDPDGQGGPGPPLGPRTALSGVGRLLVFLENGGIFDVVYQFRKVDFRKFFRRHSAQCEFDHPRSNPLIAVYFNRNSEQFP